VFQAIRLRDNHKVAIKLILPGRLADLRSRARFEQEWRILEQLDHPSIVHVLDHGSLDSGELWYAAQYIDGVPVNHFVHNLDRIALASDDASKRNRFPLERVLDLFVRICRGVEAAHQAGVLHRDLKPANILVDSEGEPHILDFGLARSGQCDSPDAVTLTGQFMGSPIWCSPEQVAARPSLIDARTDVYSIGMMLYHALTGDFPFDAELPWPQLFDSICNAEPKPLRAIRSFIDTDLETLVLKAIAKPKERRYPTVAALREDIERYLAGLPISARADTRLYRFGKFVRRNRILVASICTLLVVTVGYAISMTLLYKQAERHAADARAKFRAAREMLDFTLSQVDTDLGKLPGGAATRQRLLEKAFAQLESFLQEKSDDPALQADMAKTHARLADIAQGIGRLDRAAEAVNAALSIRQSLAANAPDDADAQAELSIALVRVGDIACARGDRVRGLESYEQSMRTDEALVAAHPENLHYLDNLSWSYERLCWSALLGGDDRRATALYDRRLEIAQQLVQEDPENPARKRNLLYAYVLGGAVSGACGVDTSDEAASNRIDSAVRLAQELVEADPDNIEMLRCYVITLRLQAGVAGGQRRLRDARISIETLMQIVDRVLRDEPDSRDWNLHRTAGMRELACIARDAQEIDAIPLLARAVEQARTIWRQFPGDQEVKDILATTMVELAAALWDGGQRDEAHTLYSDAIAYRRELAANHDSEPRHFRSLGLLLATCPAKDLADPQAGLKFAEIAAERTHRRSASLLSALAVAQGAIGQVVEARRTAEEALALLRPGAGPMRKEIETFLASLPRE